MAWVLLLIVTVIIISYYIVISDPCSSFSLFTFEVNMRVTSKEGEQLFEQRGSVKLMVMTITRII